MLNDGWNEGMTADESDAAATEMYRDSHPCCLSCEQPGCLREDCPSGLCDVEPLVICMGELVHGGCVERFKAHIENRCDGTTCHCPAVPSGECGCEVIGDCDICAPVPEAVDEDACGATEPTKVEEYEPIDVSAGRWLSRLAAAAVVVLALALGSVGCAHGPAPVVQVETVGTLVAGSSVYSQPVHATTDFAAPRLVDTGSDDVAADISTVTRADAGGDAAPDVVAKDQGLKMGDGR